MKSRTKDGIRLIPTEEEEQTYILNWAEVCMGMYPELELMYHVPNEGKRTKREGARLRRLGLRRGVSDICLPVARGGYHGLYIELKALDGKPTTEQQEFITAVCEQGYCGRVCYGGDAAVNLIIEYLNLKPKE